MDENLCFFLRVEDVATDEEGDGPGNTATYDVGSFIVSWRNPGPVHRLGAANWDPDADEGKKQGAAITAKAPLTVTEGDADGSQFALTLSSGISVSRMTVTFTAPPTVTINPTSVLVSNTNTRVVSVFPVTVTAGHDRNVISEKIVITATASGGGPNYNGKTTTIAVMTADDDFSMKSDVPSVTEDTPLADLKPKWVTLTVDAPKGGEAYVKPIQLGAAGGTGYVFTQVILVNNRGQPYDPAADTITMVTPVASSSTAGRSFADVWLVATDDLEDEEPQLIQIGADPTSEEGRIQPVMITIIDSDPEVTLSIDAVDEGADEVTMTITATAAGPMPGIFEIAADRWNLAAVAPADTVPTGFELVASGTLTIDRNQTTGTVTVTVTAPDDEDTEDAKFKIGLTTNQVVQLSPADPEVMVTVGMLEVTVTDDDKDNGNGGG